MCGTIFRLWNHSAELYFSCSLTLGIAGTAGRFPPACLGAESKLLVAAFTPPSPLLNSARWRRLRDQKKCDDALHRANACGATVSLLDVVLFRPSDLRDSTASICRSASTSLSLPYTRDTPNLSAAARMVSACAARKGTKPATMISSDELRTHPSEN